ncbi:hypothetical protein OZ13_15625 [Xanthomonas cannabis pv. cannabis]|nr:hypothetical protein OZ13_15625 [Xanthomonas cannabis pv. cannabis]
MCTERACGPHLRVQEWCPTGDWRGQALLFDAASADTTRTAMLHAFTMRYRMSSNSTRRLPDIAA